MADTDRTAHEVRSLVEALWLGGCYDLLNMPSLMSFEAIGRLLQTMVEAYANSGAGAPDWVHAFTGSAPGPLRKARRKLNSLQLKARLRT